MQLKVMRVRPLPRPGRLSHSGDWAHGVQPAKPPAHNSWGRFALSAPSSDDSSGSANDGDLPDLGGAVEGGTSSERVPAGGNEESGPRTSLKKRIENSRLVWPVVMLATVLGAIVFLVTPILHWVQKQHDAGVGAEEQRLSKLTAGVSLGYFEGILEGNPVVPSGQPAGSTRNVFVKKREYVVAVTDAHMTVLSFAVILKDPTFHPRFGGVVLGETTPAQVWPVPGAVGGVCGRPVNYFETSGSPATAAPKVRAVGYTAVTGEGGDEDSAAICAADSTLLACSAYLVGDMGLSESSGACLAGSTQGSTLRRTLHVNVYAEAAPYQELLYPSMTILESEIFALSPS